ncbi:MAG TPA: methyltransferase domain-containing protein [Gemmatimonadaceae bacterium]
MSTTHGTLAPGTKGLVIRAEARYYDLQSWLLTFGRGRAFRERLVSLARLRPGDSVLDVGCGTGTLAIAAKRRVGATGTVHGIDASPEMIALASRKAAKAGVDVAFRTGVAEALPFPDASFDAVVSTLMLHHLPKPVRRQLAREIRRVLRPGGRVLAVDFATPARERKGLLARFHRHGHLALSDIIELLGEAGLSVVESGSVGVGDLQFAVATAPSPGDGNGQDPPAHVARSLDPLPTPRWIWAALGLLLVVGHGLILRAASSRVGLAAVAVAAVAVFLIMAHVLPAHRGRPSARGRSRA